MTYHLGDPAISTWAMLIPAIASGILWLSVWVRRDYYLRRFHGWRLVWELWISNLVISGLLIGGFYWYLYWRPFYTLEVDRPTGLQLSYVVPGRVVVITPDELLEVRTETEFLPIRRRGDPRQMLVIELVDGRHLVSAPDEASVVEDVTEAVLGVFLHPTR